MIKGSDKWQAVEERLEELRRLVEENWDRREWELAVRGESTVRAVEQSKAAAAEMRQRADNFIKVVEKKWPKREGH